MQNKRLNTIQKELEMGVVQNPKAPDLYQYDVSIKQRYMRYIYNIRRINRKNG